MLHLAHFGNKGGNRTFAADAIWLVWIRLAKVSISSVDTWLQGNTFDEDHAHGVRNLVINPDLLSEID